MGRLRIRPFPLFRPLLWPYLSRLFRSPCGFMVRVQDSFHQHGVCLSICYIRCPYFGVSFEITALQINIALLSQLSQLDPCTIFRVESGGSGGNRSSAIEGFLLIDMGYSILRCGQTAEVTYTGKADRVRSSGRRVEKLEN